MTKLPTLAGFEYEAHDEIVVMRCARCGAAWHVADLKASVVKRIASAHDTARHGHDG